MEDSRKVRCSVFAHVIATRKIFIFFVMRLGFTVLILLTQNDVWCLICNILKAN
jgi:hypothetical protein